MNDNPVWYITTFKDPDNKDLMYMRLFYVTWEAWSVCEIATWEDEEERTKLIGEAQKELTEYVTLQMKMGEVEIEEDNTPDIFDSARPSGPLN